MGDKVEARKVAVEAGVPVVPGTDKPLKTAEEAKAFCEKHGLPVITKAAYGGGGRGMRVIQRMEDVEEYFNLASNEAFAAFGDGSMFIERFVGKWIGDETCFQSNCKPPQRLSLRAVTHNTYHCRCTSRDL